jgi:mannose-6-phosphate isomerase-like protein (cupin superfamily)
LIVVETPDAVLVAPLDRAQEVKALVDELEAAGAPEAHTPAQVHRPWGSFQIMDRGPRFVVKRIVVAPGQELSYQRHLHRAEHWVVVQGTAQVTLEGATSELCENESIYVRQGAWHRLANIGLIPLEIIEVQTGTYLEEDDILRSVDKYGRA